MNNEGSTERIVKAIVDPDSVPIVNPAPCGVLLGGNEIDDGKAKPINQSDSR